MKTDIDGLLVKQEEIISKLKKDIKNENDRYRRNINDKRLNFRNRSSRVSGNINNSSVSRSGFNVSSSNLMGSRYKSVDKLYKLMISESRNEPEDIDHHKKVVSTYNTHEHRYHNNSAYIRRYKLSKKLSDLHNNKYGECTNNIINHMIHTDNNTSDHHQSDGSNKLLTTSSHLSYRHIVNTNSKIVLSSRNVHRITTHPA